ncbi:hypothetical protein Emed_004132 [Eimeria media]
MGLFRGEWALLVGDFLWETQGSDLLRILLGLLARGRIEASPFRMCCCFHKSLLYAAACTRCLRDPVKTTIEATIAATIAAAATTTSTSNSSSNSSSSKIPFFLSINNNCNSSSHTLLRAAKQQQQQQQQGR